MSRKNPSHQRASAGPGTTFAVGGAKGGIGKSLFVANLGVLLAQMGKRVVLVDLDLGGANLHLYLGVWSLNRRIDDFLTKEVPGISDIVTPTKYGPMLIGGGGGKLGAANIHVSRKLKLLRALKTIDADCVIFDLGGDTTYNILDFYLAADQGFVLTTCEPASYLDAYSFIKMALHRKLTRLFGSESEYREHHDSDVERLINDFIFGTSSTAGRRMDELLAELQRQHPAHHELIRTLLAGFRPGAVVTMSEGQDQADELASRLQRVAAKMLSIELSYLGAVPFSRQIQQSTRDLVPHVAREPDGVLAKALRRVVARLPTA